MNAFVAGVSAGAIIGLGLAATNVITRTFFGGNGWISWSLGSVGYQSNTVGAGGMQ